MKHWLYDWGGLNDVLFHIINAHHAPWLDWVMLAVAWISDHDRFPIYMGGFALITLWRVWRDSSEPAARAWVLACATFSIGYLFDGALVLGLKTSLDFPRPPAVFSPEQIVLVGAPEFRFSFPSGHASFAALVAGVLWPMARSLPARWGLVFFVFVVCLSRPYLGVHFPADVVAGSALAVLVAIAVRAGLEKTLAGRQSWVSL